MAFTAADHRERALQRKAEDAARQQTLYGRHLGDVHLLRTRGFVVTKDGGSFVVGNKTVDGATLSAMADRERRLEGNVETAPHANGHAAEPAAGDCKCGKPMKHVGNCWARRGLDGPPESVSKPRVAKAAPVKPDKPRKAATPSADPIDALLAKLKLKRHALDNVIAGLEAAQAALKDD